VTTPTTPGEPFVTPSATYASLRARCRRPSRWCTPSREFVTGPASAAGASSVTPQNDATHVYPSSCSAHARPRSSQTLDLVAPRPRHQRLCDLRALTAFESSVASPRALESSRAGSDVMHWVERDVLSVSLSCQYLFFLYFHC
jgi:hypothetical protein